jgi:hypothetical protein
VLIGNGTGSSLTTGREVTAVSYQAGYNNVAGNAITAYGYLALRYATTCPNTAVGANAEKNITTGGENSLFGYNAGSDITTGNKNVYVGSKAQGTAGGSNNTVVDYNAVRSLDSSIVIGSDTASTLSNQLVIESSLHSIKNINIGSNFYYMPVAKINILNNALTVLFSVNIDNSLTSAVCSVFITITVDNGTDIQVCETSIFFMGINKAGTINTSAIASPTSSLSSLDGSRFTNIFSSGLNISARYIILNSSISNVTITPL